MLFLGEYCFEERELLHLSHVSRLGSDLGFSACCLSLGFYYIMSCILWRLFMLLDLSYVEDMAVTPILKISRKFSMCINLVLDTLKFTT